MANTTLNISVDIPQGYQKERLERELTRYALHLIHIDMPSPKRRKHAALCGILSPEMHEEEYLNQFLSEKYGV